MGILSLKSGTVAKAKADKLGIDLSKTLASNSTKSTSSSSGSSRKKKQEAAVYVAPKAPSYSNDQLLTGYRDLFYSAYQPEQLSYTERTAEEISREISAWLRPAYDAAIAVREKQTDTYRAELDADAIARGMGASSYVTDVKNRQMQQEAADIAALETDYTAQLAKEMSAALAVERERTYETNLFNAEAQQNAYDKSYNLALTLLQAYHAGDDGAKSLANSILGGSKSSSSSGAGGSSSKSSGKSGGSSSSSTGTATSTVQAIGATSQENCELFLSGLTEKERNDVYYGGTAESVAYRKELIQSVGISGYRDLVKKYPA